VLGRSIGLTQEQILDLRSWRTSEAYDPVDRLVLEYVEESKLRHAVPDDLYERLAQHFSARQIIDLCFAAGLADTINRFHATFLTDVDADTLSEEDVEEGTSLLREGQPS
jgi:alkylhydroperoxidase family enzyme